MSNELFLSIITINYNNASGLRKTLESAKNQTSKNFEHIIIDGGSSDDSVSVIKEFLLDSDYSNRVSFWCSEKDKGIYDAMNKGIPLSKGKYCLFLNSGDYLADTKVVERFESYNLTEDIIYANIIFYNSEKEWKMTYPKKLTLDFFYRHKTLSHQNTLFITSYMKNHHYSLKYKIGGDVDLYWRALCLDNLNFKYVDDVISKYECESGLSSIKDYETLRNKEWETQINEYIPKLYRDALENLTNQNNQLTQELAIYENCYHGILRKIKNLLLKYSKLKSKICNKGNQ